MSEIEPDRRSDASNVEQEAPETSGSHLRIVLMGTGPFAVPAFKAIAESQHEIVCVVTRPQPPVKSRGGPPPSPVAEWAEQMGFEIRKPASINAAEEVEWLQRTNADLLVVCDYGQILKPDVLAASRLGGINLHGSLLPAYRGAAPVQRALLAGDARTGVTVIHMTPRLDGGPILRVSATDITSDETAGELEIRLSQLGVAATMDAIQDLVMWDGSSAIGSQQDASQVSKAPRLSKAEGQIDWTRSARQIDCHVRGMQPWPVAFTHYQTSPSKTPLRVQVKSVEVLDVSSLDGWDDSVDATPGRIVCLDGVVVAAADGWLRIKTLQPAGKKEMTGEAFANGYQPKEDARFITV